MPIYFLQPISVANQCKGGEYVNLILPIKQIDKGKDGFTIICGKTNKICIVYVGKRIKNEPLYHIDKISNWVFYKKR